MLDSHDKCYGVCPGSSLGLVSQMSTSIYLRRYIPTWYPGAPEHRRALRDCDPAVGCGTSSCHVCVRTHIRVDCILISSDPPRTPNGSVFMCTSFHGLSLAWVLFVKLPWLDAVRCYLVPIWCSMVFICSSLGIVYSAPLSWLLWLEVVVPGLCGHD